MSELDTKQIKNEKTRKKKMLNHPKENKEELEVRRMKQGMSYSCKEKIIILNVFKFFRNEYPEKCVTEIVRQTAKATGCSEKSIFQFRKEEASVEGFKEPSKTKVRRNININSRDIKYDNTVRLTIRNIIYDLQFKNIVPTLKTILKQLDSDKQMPKFSVMTLRRLMFDMGFFYQKNGNKCILVENPDNRLIQVQNPVEVNNQISHHNPIINPDLSNIPPVKQTNILPPPPPPIIDSRLNPSMHIPPPAAPHHDPGMMAPPTEMLHPHPHMIHKSMPMMMNHRRDMIPPPHPHPPPVSSMDMHRKRDPMNHWMHGIIKQGQ